MGEGIEAEDCSAQDSQVGLLLPPSLAQTGSQPASYPDSQQARQQVSKPERLTARQSAS